ncbi:hypothetical protein J6590_070743 [Homalodisca vitripennis]|nr:hypothetical protein J6590_070743 [Homalodisca vitripennis]
MSYCTDQNSIDGDAALAPSGVSTPSGFDVMPRGINLAHVKEPGTELAHPDSKRMLIQRMDMAQSLN